MAAAARGGGGVCVGRGGWVGIVGVVRGEGELLVLAQEVDFGGGETELGVRD